jgi:hypothetical protein
VRGVLISFEQDDLAETKKLLQEYYREDVPEMPYTAPTFHAEAALWAAAWFYAVVQLTVLREAGEEDIKQQLKEFPGAHTPETIYSADLVLRHLPALFGLAKGLAPADMLVGELRKAAAQWPFSSVGMELDTAPDETVILSHPSLQQAYIDRIIAQKDKNRVSSAASATLIREVTGEHINLFWPGFEPTIKTNE